MTSWYEFAIAFVAFFVLHSVPVRPPVKAQIVKRIGRRAFTVLYSCVSIIALGWLIYAAARAPYVELWSPAPWQFSVTLIVMLAVCFIIAFTLGRPNPFSFGGTTGSRFDPAHAGIVRVHRHPLLVGFLLWAGSHMLPNGDLAHVILFGVFASFSLLGMRLLDRRNRRLLGAAEYDALSASVRQAPLLQSFARDRFVVRTLAGVALFAVLLLLHPAVIGVSPLAVF
ncbi:NnrU family protein [Hoeflea sp.]|uniref:NnrU family protein n=1 Tax=Hoeflea sp. TaxID=1940281 RepID=UPI003A8FF675